MSDEIRLLIVDDHALVRSGLVALLISVPGLRVIGEASDAAGAVERFRTLQPDVCLMDLRLGASSGSAAIQMIREHSPDARVIVLTTFDGDEDIFRALQAGARGYLLKGMAVEDLLSAIRDVHAGKSRIPSEIASKLAERIAAQALTSRELDVLGLIVAGCSNKEIGTRLNVSEATVKTHVNSLLGKMGVSDRTQAATTAIQRGLVHLAAR